MGQQCYFQENPAIGTTYIFNAMAKNIELNFCVVRIDITFQIFAPLVQLTKLE